MPSRQVPSCRVPSRRVPSSQVSSRRVLPSRRVPSRRVPSRRVSTRRLPSRQVPSRRAALCLAAECQAAYCEAVKCQADECRQPRGYATERRGNREATFEATMRKGTTEATERPSEGGREAALEGRQHRAPTQRITNSARLQYHTADRHTADCESTNRNTGRLTACCCSNTDAPSLQHLCSNT